LLDAGEAVDPVEDAGAAPEVDPGFVAEVEAGAEVLPLSDEEAAAAEFFAAAALDSASLAGALELPLAA